MAEETRRSRRLQGGQPERDPIDLLCGVCRLPISANLYNCTITRYCHQPIHRPCLENALRINARCPICRTRQRVQTRRSRRLQGFQPEHGPIDLLCGVCRLPISANLYNCTITRYCHQPIHRPCLENALRINARCPLCRARQGVQYPEDVNPRRLARN